MSKRSFSADFKAKVVLEIISGKKDINQAACEYKLLPNLIRNWKKDFLENASLVFDNKKEIHNNDSENEKNLIKQIDQLTIQVNWMKKKSEEIFGPEWEDVFAPKPYDL